MRKKANSKKQRLAFLLFVEDPVNLQTCNYSSSFSHQHHHEADFFYTSKNLSLYTKRGLMNNLVTI